MGEYALCKFFLDGNEGYVQNIKPNNNASTNGEINFTQLIMLNFNKCQ